MNININSISCLEELEILVKLQNISMQELLRKYKNAFNVHENFQYLAIGGKLVWFDRKTGKHVKPPKKIYGDFDCSYVNIMTLEGCPEEVTGNFVCSHTKITSLIGCPKKIGESFCCHHTDIKTLEGSPEEIFKNFYCNNCFSLTSLKGAPKIVRKNFGCANCNSLVSLDGMPEEIHGNFECPYTLIYSKILLKADNH